MSTMTGTANGTAQGQATTPTLPVAPHGMNGLLGTPTATSQMSVNPTLPQGMGQGLGQGFGRTMSPLYRVRAEAFNESLPSTVDACLKTYFKDLNGMSPVTGMYDKVIAQVEKPLIEHVLRYVRCNQVRAANILGINRNTLRKKIQTLAIDLNRLVGEHPHH